MLADILDNADANKMDVDPEDLSSLTPFIYILTTLNYPPK
jgi:hypothetical protein